MEGKTTESTGDSVLLDWDLSHEAPFNSPAIKDDSQHIH